VARRLRFTGPGHGALNRSRRTPWGTERDGEPKMLSVNTNMGAMQSLQYLNETNDQLGATQNAINTGMTVADAEDNGAIFAIAQDMRGDVAGYSAVSGSVIGRCGAVRRSVDLRFADPDETASFVGVRLLARHGKPPGAERGLPGADQPDHLDRPERGV